jgi:hypothetical protein
MNAIPVGWLLGAAFAGVIALGVALLFLRRRRRTFDALRRKIAWAQLADVVIPDDVEGEIHLDLALLTLRGILVLEVRHLSGTLFWGDQLAHWTVLDGARRTVFDNPLPGLQARRHAVHALAPRVPVDGRILLVGDVQISGETPPGVMLLDDIVTEFPARGRARPSPELKEAWQALKAAARPA